MKFIKHICPMCGKTHQIRLNDKQASAFDAHNRGEGLIQDLLPELLPWQREALISGYCLNCQRMLFSQPPVVGIEEDFDEQVAKTIVMVEVGKEPYLAVIRDDPDHFVAAIGGIDGYIDYDAPDEWKEKFKGLSIYYDRDSQTYHKNPNRKGVINNPCINSDVIYGNFFVFHDEGNGYGGDLSEEEIEFVLELFKDPSTPVTSKNKRGVSALSGYERYQLQWMIDHGYSLRDLINELKKVEEEIIEEDGACYNPLIGEAFEMWETERGFGSEIYACEEEWEENEALELEDKD